MTATRGLIDGLDAAGLNTALSEAGCLGAEVDTTRKCLHLDLEVLTLPEQTSGTADGARAPGSEPARFRLTFTGVTRIAASLREQRWDDLEPRIQPLELAQLPAAVTGFGGSRLHGWEFIDLDDSCWALWSELLSFDTTIDQRIARHVLEFSLQEGVDPRELDVRVWFDTVSVHDMQGNAVALPDFLSATLRWWDAHDKGDPRTWHPTIAPPL